MKIDNYPAVKSYLQSFGKRLDQVGEKGSRKKTNNAWFETQDQIQYHNNFEKPKIIWQEMTSTPRFYFDNQNFYSIDTTTILSHTDQSYLYYLLGILNSRYSHSLFKENFSGGGLGKKGVRYKKTYIQSLAIPVASKTEQNSLAQKAKDLLNLVKIENNQRVADGSHLGDFGFGPKVRKVILDKSHRSVSELEKIARQSRLNSKRKAEFSAWWALEQAKLEKLAKQIDKLDKAIDGEVARLYGLTSEDIFALERA